MISEAGGWFLNTSLSTKSKMISTRGTTTTTTITTRYLRYHQHLRQPPPQVPRAPSSTITTTMYHPQGITTSQDSISVLHMRSCIYGINQRYYYGVPSQGTILGYHPKLHHKGTISDYHSRVPDYDIILRCLQCTYLGYFPTISP